MQLELSVDSHGPIAVVTTQRRCRTRFALVSPIRAAKRLRLLDKVIVILPLVPGVGDPPQTSIAQQSLIRVRAE